MDTARDLALRLADLLRRERLALAEFLVALAGFDERRLWLDLGHGSLFAFLHRELRLSKGAAFYRKTAAELLRRFPEIVEPLRDGRLCLTTIVELSKVLTPENREEVLPRSFHASKAEAKEVAVEIRPRETAPRRDVVTAVRPAPASLALAAPASIDSGHAPVRPANLSGVSVALATSASHGPVHPANPASAPPVAANPRRGTSDLRARDAVEPLTAQASRMHVTVSRRFLEKLEAARAALSHSHPGCGIEEILETGLDLLLDRHARRKGLAKKPLARPRPAKAGHVPARVRRAIWQRDGGRCQWPLAAGGICGSTHRVEIDHRVAKARGGPPAVENLRCLCQTHNDLAAREVFGDEWMDRFTRRPRTGPRDGTSRGGAPPPTARPTRHEKAAAFPRTTSSSPPRHRTAEEPVPWNMEMSSRRSRHVQV